jgi:hypothetical protein
MHELGSIHMLYGPETDAAKCIHEIRRAFDSKQSTLLSTVLYSKKRQTGTHTLLHTKIDHTA